MAIFISLGIFNFILLNIIDLEILDNIQLGLSLKE